MIFLNSDKYGNIQDLDTRDTISKNSLRANAIFITIPELFTSLETITKDYICTLTFSRNDGTKVEVLASDLQTNPGLYVHEGVNYFGFEYIISSKKITEQAGELKLTARILEKRGGGLEPIERTTVDQILHVSDNSTRESIPEPTISVAEYEAILETLNNLATRVVILPETVSGRITPDYLHENKLYGIFKKVDGKGVYLSSNVTGSDPHTIVVEVRNGLVVYKLHTELNAALAEDTIKEKIFSANDIGNLEELDTRDQNTLVGAINELVNYYLSLNTAAAKKSGNNSFTGENTFANIRFNNVAKFDRTVGEGNNPYTPQYVMYGNNAKEVALRAYAGFIADIINTIGTATQEDVGFMSTEDKAKLDTLVAAFGTESGDGNSVVDTIREILEIFKNYPEGENLIQAIAAKVNNSTFEEEKGYVRGELQRIEGRIDETSSAALESRITAAEAKNNDQDERLDELESIPAASTSEQGYMSAQDKANLDTLMQLLGDEEDADETVNKIREVLAIFENYPEGDKLAQALEGKLSKESPGYANIDQVYVKKADGTFEMIGVTTNPSALQVLKRSWDGSAYAQTPESPADTALVNAKYMSNHCVELKTNAATKEQVYGKDYEGKQAMYDISNGNDAYTIPIRDANGNTKVSTPTDDNHAVNKGYADSNYSPKVTNPENYSLYAFDTSGQNGVKSIRYTTGATKGTIPIRDASLNTFEVGTPVNDNHVANKKYVDGNFVPINATSGAAVDQCYVRRSNGAVELYTFTPNAADYSIMQRDSAGASYVETPSNPADTAIANVGYVKGFAVPIQATSYNQSINQCYINDSSGNARLYRFTPDNVVSTIMQRDAAGRSYVNTVNDRTHNPTFADKEVANVGYVDEAVKLYEHNVIISIRGNEGRICLKCIRRTNAQLTIDAVFPDDKWIPVSGYYDGGGYFGEIDSVYQNSSTGNFIINVYDEQIEIEASILHLDSDAVFEI